MNASSRALVALWAANTVLCVAAGYAIGSRTAPRTTPCCASRSRSAQAPTARAPSAVAPASAAQPAAAPSTTTLVEGASPWTEPAPSQPNARWQGTLERPTTGDPIPSEGMRARAGMPTTRWLGRAPHVPLAAWEGRALEYVGDNSCLLWSFRGARWRSVDAWGQFAGRATTVGGEGYDVTRCYELDLAITEGSAGAGIYVNADSPWTPPATARFEPTSTQQAQLQQLLARYDALHAERFNVDGARQRDDRRVMYFSANDGNGQPRRFAVVGGRSLSIARLDGAEWRFVHQQRSSVHAGPAAFALVAVFDMDRDGTPEIIVHHNEFDGGWEDEVFRSDDHGASWAPTHASVGGSTA